MARYIVGLSASLPVYVGMIVEAPSPEEAMRAAEALLPEIDPGDWEPNGDPLDAEAVACIPEDDALLITEQR